MKTYPLEMVIDHIWKMDYNLLDLGADFGRELADYVKKCDPNNCPGYSS